MFFISRPPFDEFDHKFAKRGAFGPLGSHAPGIFCPLMREPSALGAAATAAGCCGGVTPVIFLNLCVVGVSF